MINVLQQRSWLTYHQLSQQLNSMQLVLCKRPHAAQPYAGSGIIDMHHSFACNIACERTHNQLQTCNDLLVFLGYEVISILLHLPRLFLLYFVQVITNSGAMLEGPLQLLVTPD